MRSDHRPSASARDASRDVATEDDGRPRASAVLQGLAPANLRPVRGAARAGNSGAGRLFGLLGSEKVCAIATDLVDPPPVDARLDDEDDDEDALVDVLGERGQRLPILARPHPDRRGRYQLATGRRQLRAAMALGTTVLALVRPLSDLEMAIAQGHEDAPRPELTYVERCLFAAALERQGFARRDIMLALGVDKGSLSHLIAVATRIPIEIIVAVGRAPRAGRLRWRSLMKRLAEPEALGEAKALVASDDFRALKSDDRFASLLRRFAGAPVSRTPLKTRMSINAITLGEMRSTPKTTILEFDDAAAPRFAAFVAGRVPALYREWLAGAPEAD